MDMSEGEMEKMQRIEKGVCRQILGAPRHASIASLRGEIGISTMKTKTVEARLKYIKNIQD